ncbi:MAG TPA: DUF4255 domain-containing protein [Caulobacteraceae bacterium]|jgi:hypothetical protein
MSIPWSTPDLSDITQVLKGLLETAVNTSTLSAANIKVFCDSPDTARQSDGNCHLNIYLLHVGRDPFWRNTPVAGPRPQLNSAQPLSLNLSYLLTAWCDKDFTSEQRAMSIALAAFHGQPIVTQDLIAKDLLSAWLPAGEFVISIEADTIDEMSRLWQAFTVPMRLSALLKVSVIFVQPLAAAPPPAIPPSVANLSVGPANLSHSPAEPPAVAPLLIEGWGQSSPPVPEDPDPSQVTASFGPLIAVASPPPAVPPVPGSTLHVVGEGLDLATNVYLSLPGTATEWDVSAWRQGVNANELDLTFPDSYVAPGTLTPAPPTAMPPPGAYALAVGAGTGRSNSIPVMVAPRVDGVVNPPKLTPDASLIYTIHGAGFSQTASTLTFGTTPLAYTGAASPGVGQFTVDGAGQTIAFKKPAAAGAGDYPILLTVGGVAASTGWVVSL